MKDKNQLFVASHTKNNFTVEVCVGAIPDKYRQNTQLNEEALEELMSQDTESDDEFNLWLNIFRIADKHLERIMLEIASWN